MSSADVGAHLLPVIFQEPDPFHETVSEGAADMVDDSAVDQAAEQLAVHALLDIWTVDCLDGARVPVDVVIPEMAAVAVGGTRRVDGQAGHGRVPREGEHEVHSLAAFLLISMQMPTAMEAGS
jgi:metal-dependent amidase/aminoacylase/carboxypeptidase family protein